MGRYPADLLTAIFFDKSVNYKLMLLTINEQNGGVAWKNY